MTCRPTNRVIIEGVDQAIAAVLQFLIVLGYMFYHVVAAHAGHVDSPALHRDSHDVVEPPFRTDVAGVIRGDLRTECDSSTTILSGIRQIKAYTVEPQALETFDKASRLVGEKHMTVMRGQSLVWPGVSFIAESGHHSDGCLWRVVGAARRSFREKES